MYFYQSCIESICGQYVKISVTVSVYHCVCVYGHLDLASDWSKGVIFVGLLTLRANEPVRMSPVFFSVKLTSTSFSHTAGFYVASCNF